MTRSSLPLLPHFETTLMSLVSALLRGAGQYPQLILSQSNDPRHEYAVTSAAVRMTYHYVAALQACSFPPDHDDLRDAVIWFGAPFPRKGQSAIDPPEMNRLEALLALCPVGDTSTLPPEVVESINARLEKLIDQRSPGIGGMNGHFNIHGDKPLFDNLWAVRVLCMARERGLLSPGLISDEELAHLLDRLVLAGDNYMDKDLALALRLYHQYAGQPLQAAHLPYLEQLVQRGTHNRYLWDSRNDLRLLIDQMHERELQIGDVIENGSAFHDMILSTCYVIENLLPLRAHYPLVDDCVAGAMQLWWSQFCGENAADFLYDLYPDPYDYMHLLARTIVAACVYSHHAIDRQLPAHLMPHLFEKLAEQHHREQAQSREWEEIEKALREWLPLTIDPNYKRLTLGLSGTRVLRIYPHLYNPLNRDFELEFPRSLVVKYGPIQEINQECENYSHLPGAVQECFVRMTGDIHIDPQHGIAYFIMDDLNEYQTLFERLTQKYHRINKDVMAELGPFLLRMHQGGDTSPQMEDYHALRELYLLPMQEYVGRSFQLLHDLLERQDRDRALALEDTLDELLGILVQRQRDFGGFPTAYMHGDLHSRNIMMLDLNRQSPNGSQPRFNYKLIDLEKVDSAGDAALDIGELLVDLAIEQRELLNKSKMSHQALEHLMARLAGDYAQFAAQRGDDSFAARVQLAKARARLRIAKSFSKQTDNLLREGGSRGQALSNAYKIRDLATQAAEHLKHTLTTLDGQAITLLD